MSVVSWCCRSTCFCVVLCVIFCTGHFVMLPLNLTYLATCTLFTTFFLWTSLQFILYICKFLWIQHCWTNFVRVICHGALTLFTLCFLWSSLQFILLNVMFCFGSNVLLSSAVTHLRWNVGTCPGKDFFNRLWIFRVSTFTYSRIQINWIYYVCFMLDLTLLHCTFLFVLIINK